MTESILTSVKKSLGIAEEYTQFDADSSTWEDFLGSDESKENLVKSYVCLKVRLLFDPPSGSSAMTAFTNLISELEWRMALRSDEKQ